MKEWINKKCKVFVRNLSDKAIVYTGIVVSVDEGFINFIDRDNNKVTININDIVQIKEEEEKYDSFYKG
jgi:hypothetical protein